MRAIPHAVLSVIIPAFGAASVLPRALASIAQQSIFKTMPRDRIEVVIAADDGGDYNPPPSLDLRVTIVPHQGAGTGLGTRSGIRSGTGPGATRNRGIMAAAGRYLAFMDADDEWSEDYLAQMLPLARRYGGGFAPTQIVAADGQDVITLAVGERWITPASFGRWPGSFHPVIRRELSPGFDAGAGQDVVHALEVLGALGGHAPMVQGAAYRLHLNTDSVTADPAFARRIDRRYLAMQQRYSRQETRLTGMAQRQAITAMVRRRIWNHAFLQSNTNKDAFYKFFALNRKNF